VVWWIFALVVIIIYASLVSHWFDVSTSRTHSIDSLLKRKMEFGVTQSSSTSFLLESAKREDLQRIWWKIQKSGNDKAFHDSISQGIRQVQESGGRYAFISEETHLNLALQEDCSLSTLGGIDMRSFGVAVQKGVISYKYREAHFLN